jgi:tRNA pseudouridine13 synthase
MANQIVHGPKPQVAHDALASKMWLDSPRRGENSLCPVVKYKPQEFNVVENLVLALADDPSLEDRFHYLKIRKCGYTTFEAVTALARHLGIPSAKIRYAGLKDEDGITEQTVAIEEKLGREQLESFNHNFRIADDRFIALQFYGVGNDPIEIGRLNGNGFRIVVRNLDAAQAKAFDDHIKFEACFLNYYDTQRFGVPRGPKTTHLIGKALLENEFEQALGHLRRSASPESVDALAYEGEPSRFFEELDARTTSFYKSSYASHEWNSELSGLLAQLFPHGRRRVEFEGIGFSFLSYQKELLEFASRHRRLPYRKYYGESDFGYRATVIQTQISCGTLEEDDAFPGKARCELSFFLPSGCYATMCVKQLFGFRDLQ